MHVLPTRKPRVAAWIIVLTAIAGCCDTRALAADPWVVYDGYDGPGKGKHVVLGLGRRGIPLRGGPAATRQDPGQAPRLQVYGAVRHQSAGRHDRPDQPQQHPRPGGPRVGRPDDHRHAVPRPARRADAAHRRVRRCGQADHRHADGHARLQHPARARPTRKYSCNSKDVGRRLRPAGARRDVDQPPRPPRQARARAA